MRVRNVIFWIHLVVGVVAGIVVAVMSATGVLLTYEKQMTRWSEWDRTAAAAPAGVTQRLPIEAVIAKVSQGRTEPPSNITIYSEADAPVLIAFGRDARVYANAYTGAAIGEGSPRLRAFFRSVTSWHRWLGQEGAGRTVGKVLADGCNLAFLFLLVSGLFLWFPRRWATAAVKAVTVPRFRSPAKTRDWNWHHVAGFWCAIPLLFVIASGVVISYAWASNLTYRAVGSTPPAQQGPPGNVERGGPGGERRAAEGPRGEGTPRGTSRPGGDPRAPATTASSTPAAPATAALPPSALVAIAPTVDADWTSITHRWPLVGSDGRATLTVDTGTGAQPQHKTQLTLDGATGAIQKTERWSDLDAGRRARSFMRFVHTGEYYGLLGQTLAGVASLAGVILVYTGFALSARRLASAWRSRRAGKAALA